MAKPFWRSPAMACTCTSASSTRPAATASAHRAAMRCCDTAIAGMQALMFDSFAFFAPNFNSHRRYLGPFVPTSRDWGHNNRSVAFRVPPGHGEARRIEHRVAGADASPHLAVAAILAGVLHGISNRLEATTPVDGRASAGATRTSPGPDRRARPPRAVDALAKYLPAEFLKSTPSQARRVLRAAGGHLPARV